MGRREEIADSYSYYISHFRHSQSRRTSGEWSETEEQQKCEQMKDNVAVDLLTKAHDDGVLCSALCMGSWSAQVTFQFTLPLSSSHAHDAADPRAHTHTLAHERTKTIFIKIIRLWLWLMWRQTYWHWPNISFRPSCRFFSRSFALLFFAFTHFPRTHNRVSLSPNRLFTEANALSISVVDTSVLASEIENTSAIEKSREARKCDGWAKQSKHHHQRRPWSS